MATQFPYAMRALVATAATRRGRPAVDGRGEFYGVCSRHYDAQSSCGRNGALFLKFVGAVQ
jgi:hypothetical protein